MFLGILVLNMLGAPTAEKCELQFIQNQQNCFLKNPAFDLPQKTLYALSPMSVVAHQKGVKEVNVTPPDSAHADFQLDPKKFRIKEDEIPLRCERNAEEFPNACSGYFEVQNLESGWKQNLMKMVLYVYSTYAPEDGKIHEMGQAEFRYMKWEPNDDDLDEGGFYFCTATIKFNSGECFGMSTTREPRAPQDPPIIWDADWESVKVVHPPTTTSSTTTTTTTTSSTTPEPIPPTPAPTAAPTPAPNEGAPNEGGMGAGTVILILLILALIGGVAGFFFRRQRLLQEEEALRDARLS